MKLIYSQEAVADLVRLRSFIATHDPSAAAHIASDLVSRVDHLCQFPAMGRSVAEAPQPDTVRDFSFGKYVVRYTLHDSALVILRIWHHFESRQGST
ncbi:MAG TPA: type II toxin-antitoxin system RelE/ParE family toxin [Chiayiivirga sp.]|nr:type II toxin-antitoxin system RelE/ParE family toxin [Chiayiivirga sp.]